ncbi:hypothetical protein [Nannocystis radixulma]|uniref:Protein kinase domain-containing protein n=1 Tax=Nannocystis radixulma TaxID=2995305 RepID=A0ABT5BLC2_9BACT|nr:hypothetical protein [Nannocystis radixulma]MDC0674213.1 hypothetical protein [Nannocystis radixulma]
MAAVPAPPEPLTADEQRMLAQGKHEALAQLLAQSGRHAVAGWVLEQIWEFAGACEHYARAGRPLDALRAAIELGRSDVLDRIIAVFTAADADTRQQAAALLQRKGRHADAARMLALGDHDPEARARALVRAGDRLGAARVLAEADRVREALAVLEPLPERHGPTLQLAAELSWELGDAEAAVRRAQAAIRAGGVDRAALGRLLARGLGALGHDLAAQIVLQSHGPANSRGEAPPTAPVPARFQVRASLPASFSGAAYEGIDRVTLAEVEIHLLLAELQEGGSADPAVQDALEAFHRRALAAAALEHPAIRGIVQFDARAGILILPHEAGSNLRALIRPPGMPLARARALVAFLLEGLAAAHLRGLVHGSLLPAQLVCDAAGRPLLGPFGADAIAGLIATRTGALEELLTITAPEVRAGATPTAASDIYSVAALLVALVAGNLGGAAPEARALVEDALADDPAKRPDAAALLARMRRRVADLRDLSMSTEPIRQDPTVMSDDSGLAGHGVVVEAAPGWDDIALDALLAADVPALQPVLDRQGRRVALAAWPEGCRRLADDVPFIQLAPMAIVDALPVEAAAAVRARLTAGAWVVTPAGEWMLALDELLTR